jgi:hypothetical protein
MYSAKNILKNPGTRRVELFGAPSLFTVKLGVSMSLVAYSVWNSRWPDRTGTVYKLCFLCGIPSMFFLKVLVPEQVSKGLVQDFFK